MGVPHIFDFKTMQAEAKARPTLAEIAEHRGTQPSGEGKEVKTEKGKHHVTAQANARKSTPTSHRKCCEAPFNCQTPSKMLPNTKYLQGPMI